MGPSMSPRAISGINLIRIKKTPGIIINKCSDLNRNGSNGVE